MLRIDAVKSDALCAINWHHPVCWWYPTTCDKNHILLAFIGRKLKLLLLAFTRTIPSIAWSSCEEVRYLLTVLSCILWCSRGSDTAVSILWSSLCDNRLVKAAALIQALVDALGRFSHQESVDMTRNCLSMLEGTAGLTWACIANHEVMLFTCLCAGLGHRPWLVLASLFSDGDVSVSKRTDRKRGLITCKDNLLKPRNLLVLFGCFIVFFLSLLIGH